MASAAGSPRITPSHRSKQVVRVRPGVTCRCDAGKHSRISYLQVNSIPTRGAISSYISKVSQIFLIPLRAQDLVSLASLLLSLLTPGDLPRRSRERVLREAVPI